VKSPVPITVTPLRRAHNVRCSRSLFLLQALEYFECMCKSVWKRICDILSQAEHERHEEHLNSARGADLE
jgi:hypothetical protein